MRALVRFYRSKMMIFLTAVCAAGFVFANEPACNTSGFISATTPLCPKTGTLLPENYPVMSVSISDELGGYDFVQTTVDKILKAQPSPAPILFLNITPEHFKALQVHLQNSPKALQRLRLVQATGYNDDEMRSEDVYMNWQQDIYKGFFDPHTGLAVAALFKNYPGIGDMAETLEKEIRTCGIPTTTLPTQFTPSPKNGFSGGNIDMLPTGICLLGNADLTDDQWETYSKNVCGKAVRVKAPTEWLSAHHVDEIFKSVPTNDPAPCNFALAFASPKRGLDLMAQNPDDLAFDPPAGKMQTMKTDYQATNFPLNAICSKLGDLRYRQIMAHSSSSSALAPGLIKIAYPSLEACLQTKNRDILIFQKASPDFLTFNLLVQQKMDAFKAQLLAQVKKNLPQCQIRTIDVPMIFQGGDGMARSIYPNPTNSDVIGKTLLMPEPLNRSFKQDLTHQFSSLGLTVDFIDTYESHTAEGNLHCATQLLRYCRPQ